MPAFSCSIELDGLPVYNVEYLLRELDRIEESSIGSIMHGIERSRFLNKCNSFTSAAGFEPGRGYVLMLGRHVNQLRNSINNTTHQLAFQFNRNVITFSKLIIVQCEGITTGKGDENSAVFLVELADIRILGAMTSINRGYNCYAPDNSQYKATLNGTSLFSYQDVVEDIWDGCMPPSFGALDLSNADLAFGIPGNYQFFGVSAWDALKKVLDDTNHILQFNRNGQFAVLSAYTASNAALTASLNAASASLITNSRDKISNAHKIPADVVVYFPSRNRAWQTSTDQSVLHPNDLFKIRPLYPVVIPTGVIGAVPGTQATFHDSMPAIYEYDGTLTNSAALNARAGTVAYNYITSLNTADNTFFYRHTGAHAFQHDVSIDCVSWYDFGDGIFTDVRGTYRPRNASPLLDMHRSGIGESTNDSIPSHPSLSTKELNGPPLVRAAELVDRFAIVRLTDFLPKNGTCQAQIQYGVNIPNKITFTDKRSINVYDAMGAPVPSGTTCVAWFHTQTNRWLIVSICPNGIPFLNNDSEQAPIGAVMNWTEVSNDGTNYFLVCKKPTSEFFPSWAVNVSGIPIPSGNYGIASWATDDKLTDVRIANTTDDPSTFSQAGPVPDSWELEPGAEGFELLGGVAPTTDGGSVIAARQHYIKEVFGVTYGQAVSPGGSGQLQLLIPSHDSPELIEWGWDPVEFHDIWLNTGETIETGTKAVIRHYGNIWCLWEAYCSKADPPVGSQQQAAMQQFSSQSFSYPGANANAALSSTGGTTGPFPPVI